MPGSQLAKERYLIAYTRPPEHPEALKIALYGGRHLRTPEIRICRKCENRKFWTIAPSGAAALNMLGLSTQVPAHWSFVSNGPYRSFSFGNITIEFRHCSSKEISGMSYQTTLVIQAIKEFGKESPDKRYLERIRRILSAEEKARLLTEARHTTAWIYEYIKELVK